MQLPPQDWPPVTGERKQPDNTMTLSSGCSSREKCQEMPSLRCSQQRSILCAKIKESNFFKYFCGICDLKSIIDECRVTVAISASLQVHMKTESGLETVYYKLGFLILSKKCIWLFFLNKKAMTIFSLPPKLFLPVSHLL